MYSDVTAVAAVLRLFNFCLYGDDTNKWTRQIISIGLQTQGRFSAFNMQEHADICLKDARRLDAEEDCLYVVLL